MGVFWGGAPIVADPAGAFGVGYVSAALVDLVGRGVLTAHDSSDRFAAASPVDMQSSFNATLV